MRGVELNVLLLIVLIIVILYYICDVSLTDALFLSRIQTAAKHMVTMHPMVSSKPWRAPLPLRERPKGGEIKIYVLTRSGSREECFKKLRQSLENQTYKNWKHIISNDNPDNTYLKHYPNIINVKKQKKEGDDDCPYNLYLNKLLDECKDGWIIILDDDAKFIDDKFLENLVVNCKDINENQIIIYDTYYGNEKKLHRVTNTSVKEEGCDMANFVFHSSCSLRFDSRCEGDRRFIKNAIVNHGYDLQKIDNIGIWANYNNQSHGKDIEC
jgi:hypothetical protein